MSFTSREVGRNTVKIPCGLLVGPLDGRTLEAHLTAMTDAPTPTASVVARIQAYAGAIAMVAVSTLLGLWIAPRWGTAPVDMIYLPAVLAAAALWGLGPALMAGIAAALAYNFFFTAPVHTFRMDRVADVVTVVVLLLVALVTSQLAAAIRAQARLAAAHAARNATIAGFARRLLSSSSEADIGETACAELRSLFDCNAMLVDGLPEPEVLASVPPGNRLTPSDMAAAALTLETGETAGRATPRIQPAEWQFHAVQSSGRCIAAVGLARDDGAPPVDEQQLLLLANLLDQLALALERSRLERETHAFAATRERDQMRATLLSLIGQELRPRLTAIETAVRSLRRSANGNQDLLSTIGSEAMQLDRYIANLAELGPEGDQPPIEAAGVKIDLFNHAVFRDGEQVHLTPKEYAVLAELAKHRGRLLPHSHLLRTVWGPAQERQIEYLRVAVSALRQKLEAEPAQPRLILNEPGVGYRLVAEP
jgi:two-component system sensor histidine kinase KdpD